MSAEPQPSAAAILNTLNEIKRELADDGDDGSKPSATDRGDKARAVIVEGGAAVTEATLRLGAETPADPPIRRWSTARRVGLGVVVAFAYVAILAAAGLFISHAIHLPERQSAAPTALSADAAHRAMAALGRDASPPPPVPDSGNDQDTMPKTAPTAAPAPAPVAAPAPAPSVAPVAGASSAPDQPPPTAAASPPAAPVANADSSATGGAAEVATDAASMSGAPAGPDASASPTSTTSAPVPNTPSPPPAAPSAQAAAQSLAASPAAAPAPVAAQPAPTLAPPPAAQAAPAPALETASLPPPAAMAKPATAAQLAPALSVTAAPAPEDARDAAVNAEWRSRGDERLAQGDIASARLFFERAAAGGDPLAARLLGTTYDPAYLARWGVRGMRGDVATAAHWYRRALALGDTEADRNLRALLAH